MAERSAWTEWALVRIQPPDPFYKNEMTGRDDNSESVEPGGVNPGYAALQIAKALKTGQDHADPATRERAKEKIAKWETVLRNILSGTVGYGTREPVAGVPGWATLEVVTGGFTTGDLLAGGPVQDHERELLKSLPPCRTGEERQTLNTFYLSESGFSELRDRLQSGCYEIAVPEEGALLAVVWLVENGHADEARELLEKISPYFGKLRFYPIPSALPRRHGSRVHLQDVAATVGDLQKIKPNQHILAQKEAVEIWAPFYDRIVALFFETVEDDWPCRQYPADWPERAKAFTQEYAELRKHHIACSKPERAQGHFAQLREFLARCASQPKSLTGREVGRIRLILQRYAEKRGRPDSAQCTESRNRQGRDVSAPMFHQFAQVVIPRLERHEKTNGVDEVSPIHEPISAEESTRFGVPIGAAVPSSIQRKVERCLNDTVQELVKRNLITSGETLARILPQMTSGLRAAGISDPALRQLYAGIYRAFRRRRSLLLLNLEKQIQIEELPWVAAIDRYRNESLSSTELARQALEEISVLTITSFPHAIIPNKLLQELRALAKGAGLGIPLVEEVAVDIFMGKFSGKFLTVAKKASGLVKGTLYSSYYGIDHDEIARIPDAVEPPKKAPFWSRPTQKTDPFVQLCASRAGVTLGTWDPATNGMIVEQQQILTTQNLAVLFMELGLTGTLRNQLGDVAKECFKWICRRQQMKIDKWHAKLIMIKNSAYAWRQMMFFLALLTPSDLAAFLQWAQAHFDEQSVEFRKRFGPALKGLILAAEGRQVGNSSGEESGAHRFLGWTNKKHWLLVET